MSKRGTSTGHVSVGLNVTASGAGSIALGSGARAATVHLAPPREVPPELVRWLAACGLSEMPAAQRAAVGLGAPLRLLGVMNYRSEREGRRRRRDPRAELVLLREERASSYHIRARVLGRWYWSTAPASGARKPDTRSVTTDPPHWVQLAEQGYAPTRRWPRGRCAQSAKGLETLLNMQPREWPLGEGGRLSFERLLCRKSLPQQGWGVELTRPTDDLWLWELQGIRAPE